MVKWPGLDSNCVDNNDVELVSINAYASPDKLKRDFADGGEGSETDRKLIEPFPEDNKLTAKDVKLVALKK